MRRGPKRKGLSLIEVLVALTIFLFAFIAISRLIDIGTQNALEIQWQTDATRLAQSKLNEVAAGVVPLLSSGSGAFDEEPEYTWRLDIGTGAVPNLYFITVTVSRELSNGRDPFEVSLTQLILDPNLKGRPGGPPVQLEEVEPDAEMANPMPM